SAARTAAAVRRDAGEFDRLFPAPLAGQGHETTIEHHPADAAGQRVADAAFALKPGEVSALLEHEGSLVLIKCIEHVGAEKGHTFEADLPSLRADILRRKVDKEIARRAPALLRDADAKLMLK